MDLQSALLVLVSVFLLILTFSSFLNRKSRGQLFFAFAMLFCSIWAISSLINHVSPDIQVITFFTRLSFSMGLVSLLFLVLFSALFPAEKFIKPRRLLLYTIPIFIGLVVTQFTPLVIVRAIPRIGSINESAEFGSWFIWYAVMTIIYLSLFINNFLTSYQKTKGIYRFQAKFILFGTSVSIALGILIGVIFPLFEIRDVGYMAPFSTVIALICIYYAIFRHYFIDLRLFLTHAGEFITLTAASLIIYYFTSIVSSLISERLTYQGLFLWILIVSMLVVITVQILSRWINAVFIKPYYDYEGMSIELNKKLGSSLDKFEVAKQFALFLLPRLQVERVMVLYSQDEKKSEGLSESIVLYDSRRVHAQGSPQRFFAEKTLHSLTTASNGALIVDQLELSSDFDTSILDVKRVIRQLNLGLLVPITFDETVSGYVLIGRKISKDIFTVQDVTLVQNLLVPFAFSLQRAILYVETKNFARLLQGEVGQATKVLKKQKEKLQEKYQFERDMMGIMGHELRTPMTVAKGMAELIIAKSHDSTIDPGYVNEKVEKIYTSIVKESDLIQTMLSTAHIDNDKINLQISEVKIDEVIEYAISAFQKEADDKGLELTYTPPRTLPRSIQSDPGRVQEIITNLISNAVKYTNQGFVHVTMDYDDKYIYVRVKDTGIGIPEDEIKNIGKKFYRIHQHLDDKKQVVRAGGTGLGLYVVKGLLTALGGRLDVKSEYAKGSEFVGVFPFENRFSENVFIRDKPVDKNDMFQLLGLKVMHRK
jgi:signal transduction histidine kinase